MAGIVYGASNWDAKPGATLSHTWSRILINVKYKSLFNEYYYEKLNYYCCYILETNNSYNRQFSFIN